MTPSGLGQKDGTGYELLWTVRAFVTILEGRADMICIEDPADDGGAEFVLHEEGVPHHHEAKTRSRGGFTILELEKQGVLGPFWRKIQAGGRCVFATNSTAQGLQGLTREAKDAGSWTRFQASFLSSQQLRSDFRQLCSVWKADPESAFEALGKIEVVSSDEQTLEAQIHARLAVIVESPETAATVLYRARNKLLRKEVRAQDLWALLAASGIHPRPRAAPTGESEQLGTIARWARRQVILSALGLAVVTLGAAFVLVKVLASDPASSAAGTTSTTSPSPSPPPTTPPSTTPPSSSPPASSPTGHRSATGPTSRIVWAGHGLCLHAETPEPGVAVLVDTCDDAGLARWEKITHDPSRTIRLAADGLCLARLDAATDPVGRNVLVAMAECDVDGEAGSRQAWVLDGERIADPDGTFCLDVGNSPDPERGAGNYVQGWDCDQAVESEQEWAIEPVP